MTTRFLAVFAVVLLISAAVWWFYPREVEWEDRTGAYHALVQWSLQRSYPDTQFPSEGYMAAFAERHAMAARTAEPGTSWEPMGPTNNGGRTLAVVINPERPESIWIGSAGGGLWRSYDAGLNASWERVTIGFPVTSASTVAIAESDTNVVYLGTGEVYRYQDTRGGVLDRPTRGSYGIGILKTEDGGASWSHVLDWSLNQERGVARVRVHPMDEDNVWAATTEGVYHSSDGGATWDNVNPVIMAMDVILHPTDPDVIISAHGDQESAGKGIYRSTNGGTTWTQLTSGVPSNFIGKIILDRHPTDMDIVYASVGNGITSPTSTWLIRTLDGGDTWSTVTTLDYARYQGWFAHYVGISPHDPDLVYLAGVSFYKSTDGGFTASLSGSMHVDHHAMAFHPTDPDIAYFANDGGIYRTTNGGTSYEDLNEGYTVMQFYNSTGHAATDSLVAIAGAQDNGTWMWTGSSSWAKVGFGDGSWAAIDPTDANIQYLSSQFLNMSRTLNMWGSSTGISPPGGGATAFIAPYVLAPSEPERLYAGRNIIYRSDNRGSSWTATNGGVELDGNAALAMAVSPQDADVVYVTTAPDRLPGASGNPTGVHITTDGGDTWTDVTGTLPDRMFMDVAVDPSNAQTAYVTASGFGAGHVFKTTNGGTSWTDITGTLPDAPTSAVVVDPLDPNEVYVGNDVGVFVSRDGGGTWESFNVGLPEAVIVTDLAISPMDRSLRVGTHGNGMWKRSIDRVVVANEPGSTPTGFALESITPNPVRTDANIAFRLERAEHVRIAVYDLRGREVAVLVDRSLAAGRHTAQFRSGGMASGSYAVRLEVEGKVETLRMTIVR